MPTQAHYIATSGFLASMSAAFFARFHVWRVEPVQHRRGVPVRQDFENYWNRRQEMARPPQRSRPL